MSRRVTAAEIADACGVSRPTVSRILTGGDVAALHSDATRRLVEEAAERLGYRPNTAARAIKTGKFGQFALMIGALPARRGAQPQMLDGLLDACEKLDSHLLVVRGGAAAFQDGNRLPRVLRESACDGLVLDYTHEVPLPLIDAVQTLDVPVAWLNTRRRPTVQRTAMLPGHVLRPDDEAGAETATKHLIELGHTRIAYFDALAANDRSHHYSHAARRLGWSRALRAAGLSEMQHRYNLQARASRFNPHEQLMRVMTADEPPTALVMYGGNEVSLVEAVAGRLNLSVPEDLSLVTFADERRTQVLGRDVTYISVPHAEVARRAIALLARPDHQTQTDEVRVEMAMVRPDSTATSPR